MTKEQRISIKNPKILFLSFFGTGFSPIAPGTVGSLATIPLLLLLYPFVSSFSYPFIPILLFSIILFFLSVIICEDIQKKYSLHDPGFIVIDEVLGMLVTWSFSVSITPMNLALTFILFRIFDIIKIWPASFFDKKVKHGFGTIFDDIISAVYAGIVLYIIHLF